MNDPGDWTVEEQRAIADDLRVVLEPHPSDPVTGCPLCGNLSVCHACDPRDEARMRLRAAMGAK